MSNESPEIKGDLEPPPVKPEDPVIAPPPSPDQCVAIANTINDSGTDLEKSAAQSWATEYLNAVGKTSGGQPVATPKGEEEPEGNGS